MAFRLLYGGRGVSIALGRESEHAAGPGVRNLESSVPCGVRVGSQDHGANE